MAKARDILGKSGTGGFTPPPQTKKLDLTVHEEPEGEKKPGASKQQHTDKPVQPKGGTKTSGGPPTSVRPKV